MKLTLQSRMVQKFWNLNSTNGGFIIKNIHTNRVSELMLSMVVFFMKMDVSVIMLNQLFSANQVDFSETEKVISS